MASQISTKKFVLTSLAVVTVILAGIGISLALYFDYFVDHGHWVPSSLPIAHCKKALVRDLGPLQDFRFLSAERTIPERDVHQVRGRVSFLPYGETSVKLVEFACFAEKQAGIWVAKVSVRHKG